MLILFLTKGNSQRENILWAASLVDEQLIQIRVGEIKDIATSPQGDKLAIIIHTDKGDQIEVIRLDQNLTSIQVIDHNNFDAIPENLIMQDIAWSNDGHNLGFSADFSGQFDLYLFQETTQKIIQLTDTNAIHEIGINWSP